MLEPDAYSSSEQVWVQPRKKAVVMSDWEFHVPFGEKHVITYTKGEEVEVDYFIPARMNQPFGFPFYWGTNGKPYPGWLIDEVVDGGVS